MKRIVYGEVLAPDVVDGQGDVACAEEIEAAAHRFLAHRGAVGGMHRVFSGVGDVVESFIAREGDPDFPAGAWVLGVRLGEEAWERVRRGEWTGFSVGGRAVRTPEPFGEGGEDVRNLE